MTNKISAAILILFVAYLFVCSVAYSIKVDRALEASLSLTEDWI